MLAMTVVVLWATAVFAGEMMTTDGVVQDSGAGLILMTPDETYGILSGVDEGVVGKTVIVTGEVSVDDSGKPVIAIEEVQVQE